MRTIKVETRNDAEPTPRELDRVYWQADLAARYGVDRVTVYRWSRDGILPPPDVVLGRRHGRYGSTLRAWEASTTAASKR